MRFGEQNRIVLISYLVGTFLNLLIEFIIGNFPGTEAVISSLKTVSILTVWWWFYFKIGWKLPLLKKMLPRINLNGTWFGEYESYKSHDKKKQVSFGKISVRIKQDYLNIGLNSFTEQSHHSSYSEELTYDEKNDIHGIVYVYSQKENSIFDTAKRNGTSEFTLKNINNEHWLEGDFWTIHGTQGKIKVKRISKKHIDTFDEAKSVVK